MSAGTTPGGFLLVLAIMLPVGGLLLSFLLGGRHAERVAIVVMPFGVAVAAAIAAGVWRSRNVLQYVVGGWHPPLGVALRADGLSAAMIVTAALLVPGIGLFARAQFATPPGAEARAPLVFWTLLLAVWAALNAVFLGADLFNLFVALELLTFAAVPLVCLDGRADTLAAALRYLLFALLGSVLYLLGTVLLYGAYGTLDIAAAGRAGCGRSPLAWVALSLMTAGLLAKAALYPLHLWLPPAHAGAPAPASAVLSGLVVKAPFFLVVRLVVRRDARPCRPRRGAAARRAGGGGDPVRQRPRAAAGASKAPDRLLDGRSDRLSVPDVPAFRQVRRWAIPGAIPPGPAACFKRSRTLLPRPRCSWRRGWSTRRSGTTASPGSPAIGRALPITIFAFGLGGLSLMGLPPSGGFVAKAMLLTRGGRARASGGGRLWSSSAGCSPAAMCFWCWRGHWPIRASR